MIEPPAEDAALAEAARGRERARVRLARRIAGEGFRAEAHATFELSPAGVVALARAIAASAPPQTDR